MQLIERIPAQGGDGSWDLLQPLRAPLGSHDDFIQYVVGRHGWNRDAGQRYRAQECEVKLHTSLSSWNGARFGVALVQTRVSACNAPRLPSNIACAMFIFPCSSECAKTMRPCGLRMSSCGAG